MGNAEELEKPKVWDPVLEALAERGSLHEQGFVEHIKSDGIAVTVIEWSWHRQHVGRRDRRCDCPRRSDHCSRHSSARRWSGRTDVLRRADIHLLHPAVILAFADSVGFLIIQPRRLGIAGHLSRVISIEKLSHPRRILEARTRPGSPTHGRDSGLWELAVFHVRKMRHYQYPPALLQ
jgi:hypothetical protein